MSETWYQRSYRRILVVFHLPDWHEEFLSKYDPEQVAELYARAGVTSELFMVHSHIGVCLWPTKVGKVHAAVRNRDLAQEQIRALKKRNIAICAYYSIHVNNWAFLEHPDWRIQPANATPADVSADSRWARVCPNHPDYRAFAMAQAEELAAGYDFDGLFFDMVFWPTVCLCSHCRARYRDETGREIPRVVDWTEPDWCAFQAARERWMTELARDLKALVKRLKPDMSVYHNFAPAFFNWVCGQTLDSAVHHDYLGADYYGDPIEQLMVSKATMNLCENRPPEFMSHPCPHLRDYARLEPFDQMRLKALAAVHLCAAPLFMDEPHLDGTLNPAYYDRLAQIFGESAPYEPFLGGEPVEDIAIYLSSDSKMSFSENGTPLSRISHATNRYPHMAAVRGACRALQEAHVPFGVITRKQLADLSRYKLVVLPNVLRMDAAEVDAFRQYVAQGGKLYASRYTSLTETNGTRHPDFMLADLFGCHFEADDLGEIAYLRPQDPAIAQLLSPQEYVSVFPQATPFYPIDKDTRRVSALRLNAQAEGDVLGTLTLPYASGKWGTIFDQDWSSIHNAPPWEHTASPVIVRNEFGKGRVVYVAADLESLDGEASNTLLTHLLLSLVDEPLAFGADTHPVVWMNVFHQEDKNRFLVGFLNFPQKFPTIPIRRVPFFLRPPQGKKFVRLLELPGQTPLPFETEPDGTLRAEVQDVADIRMLLAETD